MVYNYPDVWKIVMGDTYDPARVNPASYDVTLAEDVLLGPADRTVLVATAERVALPVWVAGAVHPKSSRLREGIQIPPGWVDPGFEGNLTFAATYVPVVQRRRPFVRDSSYLPGCVEKDIPPPWHHRDGRIMVPAGTPIAQLVLHQVAVPAQYEGRYQNAEGVRHTAEVAYRPGEARGFA